MKNLVAGAVVALGALAAQPSDAATLGAFGNPWGEIGTVEAAMDGAFGAGGWNLVNDPTDTAFLSGESFVYLEGGDGSTLWLASFLETHSATLLDWISRGGHMLINAAPNVGTGFSFGGMTLNYPASNCGISCEPVDPSHPIFAGISTTSFSGGSFSHGTVSGGSSLIADFEGQSLLSEMRIGDGLLLMGTMTTTNFHNFADAQALRSAIIGYAADGGTSVAVIPLPATGVLLLGALGGLAMLRRRKQAA